MNPVRVFLCGVAVCLVARADAAALTQPEPSPAPVSWELSFAPTPPMRIQVDTGRGPRTYWYMLYTVTNQTGKDVDFHPEIVRVNEIKTELPAEYAQAHPEMASHITVDPAIVGLHSKVFRAIRQRHAKTHPFLVPPVDAIGKLLQGKDNARTSVAVFSDLDPRVSRFTIYVSGLSGERIRKANPMYDARRKARDPRKAAAKVADGDDNPRFFVLRKTLAMPYTLPGDVKTRKSAKPALGMMTWVMR